MDSRMINDINMYNVQRAIEEKKQFKPYYATVSNSRQVITDYDTFPYPRWYRGEVGNNLPVVAEREAGWRVRNDDCYKVSCYNEMDIHYPYHCFEAACSTTFPCIPNSRTRLADREAVLVALNKNCIPNYR